MNIEHSVLNSHNIVLFSLFMLLCKMNGKSDCTTVNDIVIVNSKI